MSPTSEARQAAQDGPGRAITAEVTSGATSASSAVLVPTRTRRPRPEREADELEAMVDRMLRALARRAAAGDLIALEGLANLEAKMPAHMAWAIRNAHDGPGHYSWAEIGAALGVTRQAAEKRSAK